MGNKLSEATMEIMEYYINNSQRPKNVINRRGTCKITGIENNFEISLVGNRVKDEEVQGLKKVTSIYLFLRLSLKVKSNR